MACGCYNFRQFNPSIDTIHYCPLHKAAPDLLKACKAAREHPMRIQGRYGSGTIGLLLDNAIAKAELHEDSK